jgi:hypothetical protein
MGDEVYYLSYTGYTIKDKENIGCNPKYFIRTW